jgi:hypothetical protein
MTHAIVGSCCAALIAALALAVPARSLAQGVDKYQDVPKPRAVPAPAPPKAQPAAPKPQPGGADALIKELMRPAAAGENEEGYCARIRVVSSPEFYRTLERVKQGDVFIDHAAGLSCAVQRVTAVLVSNGEKCVKRDTWGCWIAGRCATGPVRTCKSAAGTWGPVIRE